LFLQLEDEGVEELLKPCQAKSSTLPQTGREKKGMPRGKDRLDK